MRLRLFKLSERTRLLALGLSTLCWLALDASCSGQAFTASDAPGGSGGAGGASHGEAGASDSEAGASSSEAGEGGTGGTSEGGGGATSSAGSAGKPPVGCDCAAAEYCQDGANKCRKCADFSRLEFGTAQKLLAQNAGSIERFARLTGSGSALFYVSGAADKSKILYTSSPASGSGTEVTRPAVVESGPLFVRGFVDGQNLFFDRLEESGRRKLHMALWTPPATLANDVPVDSLNGPDADDYSIAISTTKHVYWMSTRNHAPELLWQATGMDAPPPAVLDLKLKVGAAECARSGEDATPWVNLAGTLLLFRNPSLNDSCEVNDSGATDLFAVQLNSDGVPTAAATALASLNKTGGMSKETDPSLSADACTVYFASDNGTDDFDLYKAPRK